MGLNASFSAELLSLIFENQDIANLGDASGVQGSSSAGDIEIALIQSNGSEANYTSYQRVFVNRNTSNWSNSSNSISNALEITFPTSTGGSNTINKFRLYYGNFTSKPYTLIIGEDNLTGSVTITAGETPKFAVGALTLTFS
jgi:hypothetical protein